MNWTTVHENVHHWEQARHVRGIAVAIHVEWFQREEIVIEIDPEVIGPMEIDRFRSIIEVIGTEDAIRVALLVAERQNHNVKGKVEALRSVFAAPWERLG